jgi:uncharacterized protein (TIGR02453 family)
MSNKEPHFSPELFRFMRQLKRNNRPEWFKKHRDRYIEVARDPMLRFIADFGAPLHRISPNFVADPRPQGGSMFRIYRDIRFSKDKRPYKTVTSAQFRHNRGKDVHAPGFYIHLGADEVFAGAGIWHPDGAALLNIRNAIVEQPARWKKISSAKAFRAELRLSGESLKRAPRGFDPEHPLIEDLKRKDFVVVADLDEKSVCAPDFIDRYAKICRVSAPLVRFLTEALGLEW